MPDHSEFILENQLKAYAAQGVYPMHMPGHKRQPVGAWPGKMPVASNVMSTGADVQADGMPRGVTDEAAGLPYGWDVTEVPGTDDLHDAQGILREAMDRTAALYGVERTWYLVNGSTCGLLAGIRAIAPYGSEVIVARNCHKAVYHAIELQNLTVHWIWPARNADYEIYESVDPASVAALLERYPDTAAVILTSPTYEGMISDIRSMARICHEHSTVAHPYGIPLLVDEAHGAHLGFHAAFPDSAVDLGADLVIQSPHKTLPSLTQTAWMHLPYHSLVEPEDIERELDVFETSSPSYPLMASLDGCTGILREHGEEMFAAYAENLERILRPAAEALHHLRVFGYDENIWADGRVYALDPSKVLISGKNCEIDGEACTGARLADLLREDDQIETEMHLGWNVLAMTSICDTMEGMQRLADALADLDQRAVDAECIAYDEMQGDGSVAGGIAYGAIDSNTYKACGATLEKDKGITLDVTSEAVCTIAEATRAPAQTVRAEHAVGRVAAEYVYCYPPGIPVIVPGERITEDILQQLQIWDLQGATIHHSAMTSGYRVVAE